MSAESKVLEKSNTAWVLFALISGMFWLFLFLHISNSKPGDMVDTLSAKRIEFYLRQAMGKGPELDPRIKIFVYDDPTVAADDGNGPSLEEWSKILASFDKQSPSRIFVDKIFGAVESDPKSFKSFVRSVSRLKTPVVVGGFYSESKIKGRPLFNANGLATESGVKFSVETPNLSPTHPIHKIPREYFYGPNPGILSAFDFVGHLNYQGEGYFYPFVKNDDGHAVPHAALFAADNIVFKNQSFLVDDTVVNLDRKGRIFANFLEVKYFYSRTYSMSAVLRKAYRGQGISVVDEGDTVVILPAMYTGSMDWVSTPVGDQPGGILYTAMINSAMTGQFVHKVDLEMYHLALAVIPCVLIAILLPTIWVYVASFLFLSIWVVSGLMIFSYYSVSLPWLYPLCAGILTIHTVSLIRIAAKRREKS